jgi:hypothetical protein
VHWSFALTVSRLLNPGIIPASLWETEAGVLRIPGCLAIAYENIVDRQGLRELAASRDRDNPPVGGLTKELTDQHFAQAFDGSAARALLALLDPHSHLPHVSNTFIEALAGSTVCIIDAPCGACATSFAFLAAIAELRMEGILPRIPLDVSLVAADLSDPAREYANSILSLFRSRLEEQGIFVTEEFHSWDATDQMSTTHLVQRSLACSPDGMRRLVLVANFNGFLVREKKRSQAEPQLQEFFRYLSSPQCAALWIEPNMNRVTQGGGLFSWIVTNASNGWRRFMTIVAEGSVSHFISSARYREPLDSTVTPNVRIAVMRIQLELQK